MDDVKVGRKKPEKAGKFIEEDFPLIRIRQVPIQRTLPSLPNVDLKLLLSVLKQPMNEFLILEESCRCLSIAPSRLMEAKSRGRKGSSRMRGGKVSDR